MPTIFDTLVTKENDHTNLLWWVMERHPGVAAASLSLLLGRTVGENEARDCVFRLQSSHDGASGREIPDLVVEGRDLYGLVEVKVDPALELTTAQRAGYRGCFPGTGERCLTFLVPNRWKHGSVVAEVRLVAPVGVTTRIVYWRELIDAIDRAAEPIDDRVLGEVVQFWKWRFGVVNMTIKERAALSTWSEETYGAVRKLEKVITQAKGLFDARGVQTELETSDTTAYGFYVKRDRLYLLWIGMWTKAPSPLCFGYHATKGGWTRPNEMPTGAHLAGEHQLWQLGPDTWDDPEMVYETVSTFLKMNY